MDVIGGTIGRTKSTLSSSESIMSAWFERSRYLTVKSFSGKIKKIQKKEFCEMFDNGEYYPSEGSTIFSLENSSTFYIYGGARAKKPGHWGLANHLFQITTSQVPPPDNSAHEIVSFKMYNHSVSKTSQFTKLFAASGLTEECTENSLLGFTINGKNLDCPSEKLFLSNEIRIFEIASDTTFRNSIIRTGVEDILIGKTKDKEQIQTGDIPQPSYAASLVRTPTLDTNSDKTAIKIGGGVLANPKYSDLEHLFSKKPFWEEKSSSEIHILRYNVENKHFDWTEMKVAGFEPRAFHSAVLIDRFIYIFGGLNLETEKRYSISPVRININDWTLSKVDVGSLGVGCLAGAGILPLLDKVYLIGGYNNEVCRATDKPCDRIIEVSFSSQGL